MKKAFSRFKINEFWKSVAILGSASAIAQIIGFITTPIVSRLYNTEAFGQYFLIVSIATIIISISSLGLNSAVMEPINDDECDEVFLVAFFTFFLLATIIIIILIAISPYLKLFDSGLSYFVSCILVYFFVIANNLNGLLIIYVNRKSLNKVLFYNSLISVLATLLITIPLGILKWGSMGLITAAIIASILSSFQMLLHTNPFKRIPNAETFKAVFRKYKDYIQYQYPANAINQFTVQLPMPTFSAYFGNAKLGTYSMNDKLLGVPSRFIAAPISTIYFRTASEYYKKGDNLADFTFSLVSKIMIIAFLPIVLVVFFGEPLFEWFLGPGWGEAGNLAAYLVLYYVFVFCQNCTSYCRVAIGKQKTNLAVSIMRLIVVVASLFVGIYFFNGFTNLIICFVVGSSIYYIFDMRTNFWCMQKNSFKYAVFASIYFSLIILMWFIKVYL